MSKPNNRHVRTMAALIVTMLVLIGCQSAYYKTMEELGYHKRELLVDSVEEAQESQKEAKEQFQSALEAFAAVTNFQGGELEEKYEKLNEEYEDSNAKAEAVRERINDVEDVAEALFDEWKSELDQYTDDRLRRISERKLDETRERYKELIRAMKRAEEKIDPVLLTFRDQVLFLEAQSQRPGSRIFAG
jgi:Type IIA topoisomerase (DNA gyrase/topo II, topoisomerase IV), A subunit